VRHHAGGDAGDFEHGVGVDDGDAAGNRIAVQVEIDDVEEIAVGGDVGGGGEKAEADLTDDAVALCFVFKGGPVRAAVTDRDVEIFSVGGEGDAVRAADIALQHAGLGGSFEFSAVGAETDGGDAVRGFADELDPIVGRWSFGGLSCERDRDSEDWEQRRCEPSNCETEGVHGFGILSHLRLYA